MLVLLSPLSAALLVTPPVQVERPSVATRARCLAVAPPPGSYGIKALKSQLLESAAAFKAAQEAEWQEAGDEPKSALLNAESVANIEASTKCTELRAQTISLIEELSRFNPTSKPFEGWREAGSPLEGGWDLAFTTGADATFRKTETSGAATTYQEIDSKKGMFINCIDFDNEENKLKGFRVYVAGVKISDTEVQLKFRAVKLLRRSRIPSIVIPLPPSWFLRGIAKLASRGKAKLSDRGAGFQILYLDDEIRMHKTFDGQYFVQKRRAGGGVSAAASSESEAATLKAYGKRSEDAGNGFVWGKTY